MITVSRRHVAHGNARSAFRHPAALAVREAVKDARLVTAGTTGVSWITMRGLRLTGHVVIPLPPGSPEPPAPRFQELGTVLLALLYAACFAFGILLKLRGWWP